MKPASGGPTGFKSEMPRSEFSKIQDARSSMDRHREDEKSRGLHKLSKSREEMREWIKNKNGIMATIVNVSLSSLVYIRYTLEC